jgi:hypothetical protein
LVSFHDPANRFSINPIKHKSDFVFAFTKSHSKFFTKLLHRSTQAFDRSTTQCPFRGTNPAFPSVFFAALEGFSDCSKPNFTQDRRVNLPKRSSNRCQVIPMIQQNRDLRDVDWFSLEILDVLLEHFNQPLIV